MTAAFASWALLFLFIASWVVAALWAGRVTGSMPSRQLAPLYGAGLLFCIALVLARRNYPVVNLRLWPEVPPFDWAMVAVVAAGLAFCWWARLHLGKLWSGGVVVREGHRVVDTGPYGIVRHPIYTGGFVAALAMAAIHARPFDLAFTAGLILFFSLKARIEERFLRQQFGMAYADYGSRVPMLVPGFRRPGAAAGG